MCFNASPVTHFARAMVSYFFYVDDSMYEGDSMDLSDPRGGTRAVYFTDVKINRAGGEFVERTARKRDDERTLSSRYRDPDIRILEVPVWPARH